MVVPADTWVVFPWEQDTPDQHGPADAVTRLIEHIGEDPTRPGLIDTPRRVLDSLTEMTAGYRMDPAVHLGVVFPDKCDEMVVVTGIDFTSMCEHHMLTFTGTVAVGYIPDGQVVGLSKLARVVDVFSQRLQVQERMTEQIANAIDTHLDPKGVGVVVRARHSCMGCRGVRKPAAEMTTSALLGYFKDDPKARAEFLSLARPH
ncbi:MAG: GTP cyclohydrolase I FolE [Rhodospirillales bacterium]|nr:GTP cyclohydrolase I FolE [Rhodospirillales bacterium]